MRFFLRLPTLVLLLALVIVVSPGLHVTHVLGQITQGDDDNDEDEDPTTITTGQAGTGNAAGVSIDALDVVRSLASASEPNELDEFRKSLANVQLPPCPRKPAKDLRFVSLPRLERIAEKRLAAGQTLTDEMRYLAGLVRADYLLIYPETGDVVIAGPASDWRRTKKGDVLSASSKQPVLRLEDLVVALRAFPFGKTGTSEIGCSIDPTQQGLARMQAYVKSVSGRPPSAPLIAAGLKKTLGEQKVTVLGIPAQTHFAHVMVEADYRMKLIGIGLATPAVPIKSYLSLATARSSSNGLARWYFTPQYESIRISSDRRVMRLGSNGAQLIGQAELVAKNGKRSQSARRDRASMGFTTDFTRKYVALAKAEPVYAELRNVMDISIIAAAMHLFDAYAECDWKPKLFLDATRLNVENREVPTKLPTAVNAVWKGRRLLTPVGGGVSIRSADAMESMRLVDVSLNEERPEVPADLTEDQWWWDSK